MRRQVLGIASLVLSLVSPMATQTALAHGGQYRGPPGEVPPDSRTPQDPPPPDTGDGTPTPPDTGGGGTPTPPDDPGGTPTPPDPGTPDSPQDGGDTPKGPDGGGGIKSGAGRSARKAVTFESWRYWWHANKDALLDLRRRGRAGASTGGLGTAAEGDSAVEEQNVTARTVETRVVPLLKKYARDRKVNFDVQASAVLGLARIGRREEIPLLMEYARNLGPDKVHGVVQETAALALGELQEDTPEVRRFLGELALDEAAPKRTRCFAAFSLGLLGGPDSKPGDTAGSLATLRSLAVARGADKDLVCSALVGIGLLGDPSAVPDLLGWLRAEKAGANGLDDLSLSYVAAALGKIGRPGLAGPDSREVVEALRDRLLRRERITRWSSAIALGQVGARSGPAVRRECVSILSEVVRADGRGVFDAQTTNFALVGLGRIAGAAPGADGTGGCPEEVRLKAMGVLERAFDGKDATRSFAALGMALGARDHNDAIRRAAAGKILEVLVRLNGDVEQRGALVVALGLLRDVEATGALRNLLGERGLEKPLRGAAAVALGLIGDRESETELRSALLEKDDRELRVNAAIALGLLRDFGAVRTLVALLRDSKSSQSVLGSASVALGKIGDQTAVEPLAGILDDARFPDLTRALACVSLGQIGDRNDLPVLSRVSEDVNYRAYYDALAELMTIL